MVMDFILQKETTYELVDLRKCWVRNAQSLGCNTVERSVVKDDHTVCMKRQPLQRQYGVVRLHHDVTELVLNNITINEYTTTPLI